VLFLSPIAPDVTGNGLAMRAGLFVEALQQTARVLVAVVPVAGHGSLEWSRRHAHQAIELGLVPPGQEQSHVTAQLAEARLRDRLEVTAPLPVRARSAPPTLAPGLLDRLSAAPRVVLALRLSLAPLAIEAARLAGAGRVVIDSDDDDEPLLRSLGDGEEADAHHRLAAGWLPAAETVLAASRNDADRLAARHALADVRAVPNAVHIPIRVTGPPAADRLLFLGNLTYEPNVDAARRLVTEILPRVRRQRPGATLSLVGACDHRVDSLIGDGVVASGAVRTVGPAYDAADVVVVPLAFGSGTRIKVLEAFAHRRPVVATPTAVAGLDVDPGVHAFVAHTPDDLAAETIRALEGGPGVGAMIDRAEALVRRRYTHHVIGRLACSAVLGDDWAAGRSEEHQ
jgi:glycosyltransferase involved in cell wall biosynthesis